MNDSNNPHDLGPIARRAIEQSIDYTGETQQGSLFFGLIAGVVAAVLCAFGWAAFTIGTGMQLGLLAIAIGLIVGVAVRFAGRGWEPKFGVMAAVLALGGCVLGNCLIVIVLIVQAEEGLSYMDVILGLGMGGILGAMIEFFDIMDILFYGIAVTSAYRMGYQE